FYFQAEDGIRDKLVTGVQTCALPIWVRALIRRGGACRTELLSYGPVELDRLKHKVKVKGKKLELTPKEFQLLEHFLLRPEEVIRSEERRVGKECRLRMTLDA